MYKKWWYLLMVIFIDDEKLYILFNEWYILINQKSIDNIINTTRLKI